MVAYSFQKRFCGPIVSGSKRQTIRGQRARHARPGEPIQLYFAMRTKNCRKLLDTDPVCLTVEAIQLLIPPRGIATLIRPEACFEAACPDEFAREDGFLHADDLTRFWRGEHGEGLFTGVLIRWAPVASDTAHGLAT